MRVLVACEFSGTVREAFRLRGHDAVSCDLEPTEIPGPHYQGDVRDILGLRSWDLLIGHPPCTFLARSGARWWPGREQQAREARDFVLALYNAPVARVAIENPVGQLNRLWRYPDQTIEPYYFGDPYRKRTNLWLRGLPPLMATNMAATYSKWVSSNRFARVTRRDVGDGTARNPKDRARTFQGIADAMATQWGDL